MNACTKCDGEASWHEDRWHAVLEHYTEEVKCSHCDGTGEEPAPRRKRPTYPADVKQRAVRRLLRQRGGWSDEQMDAECGRIARADALERKADAEHRAQCGLRLNMLTAAFGVGAVMHPDWAVTALHYHMISGGAA